jgi:hypothetical protein
VDRPRLDAVAVLVVRKGAGGFEVLTRMNLRPAAYFRKDKQLPVPDKTQVGPKGDGSPLEEAPEPRWRTVQELSAAIAAGEVQDAKTEIALTRYLLRVR